MTVITIILILLCAVCTVSFAKNVQQAHDHSFEIAEIHPAGIGEKGLILYKCTGCEETKTEEIPAIASIAVPNEEFELISGEKSEPSVLVKDENGNILVNGTDYKVTYSGNDKPGTAKATVTFTGNYAGTETFTFKILCTHTYGAWESAKKATTETAGEKIRACSKCGKLQIKKVPKIGSVTLEEKSMKYTGKACKNKVSVRDSSGNTLKNGIDYTVKYKNNVKFGTATATVSFKGFYSGTVNKTYKITHNHHTFGSWKAVKCATTKENGVKQRSCTGCGYKQKETVYKIKSVTLSKKSAVYTGKNIKPAVTVKNEAGKTLTKGKSYTLTYSSNKNVGTAKVTVTFIGFYDGKVTKSFRIYPSAVTPVRVVPGSREILVNWKKQTKQISGYQVQCASDKAFTKGVHTFSVKNADRTGMMIYDLKEKNTYYVRIRNYLTKNGKNYYSKWSPVLSAKTKTPGAHYIEGSVPESAAASTSYFKDAVFVGDSVSLGLYYYEVANDKLGDAQFLTAGSLGSTNALWEVSDLSVHPRYNGVKMKLEKSIPLTKAKKIYIMLGMNDISYGVETAFKNFKTLTENIQKAAPYAMFYVESVTPKVNQGEKNYSGVLNNKNINIYNNKLSQLCREKGWYFINVAEAMFDNLGFLKREYCGDPDGMGMHFIPAGCAAWVDYLYKHTA